MTKDPKREAPKQDRRLISKERGMSLSTLRWLYQVPGKKRGYVLSLSALYALTGSMGVVYALLMRAIVDSAVAGNMTAFWENVLYIVALVAVRLGLNALIRWLDEQARTDLENCFKQRLTKSILKKDYASVSAIHSGEWMNRLTSDTGVVAGGFVDILPGLVGTLVRLVSALVMIIALDAWFAYILLPGGLLLVGLTYAFRKVLKRLHKSIQEADGRLRIFLQERIGGLLMIKSFAAEEATEAAAADYMRRHKAARMRRLRFSNLCNVGFGAAMQGMYLLGAVYCAYGILNGTVSYGTMTAVMQLIGQVQAPFANISGYLPRFYAMSASAERLMEVENFADDGTENPLSMEAVNGFYEQELAAVGLQNASFTYYAQAESMDQLNKDNMPVVLQDFSVEISKGEYVAFTGHSGCGKSTALKLFMCMYRLDGGSRYIRTTDGMEWDLSPDWRRLFAYVPQGNQLVSDTIRRTVAFSAVERAGEEEALWQALQIACADEFVRELENGLDTKLGERGTGLSEGQMQRIAIARAIFSGSPVLLLDEATSALDEQTEERLLQNLRSLTDKTVLIVTHRPAALKICDRVLRFTEDGVETV